MNLPELIKLARKDLVVLRPKGKTFFAVIRLDETDLDAISLSKNPDFIGMLNKLRARYDSQEGLTLEEAKQRLAKRRGQSTLRKKIAIKVTLSVQQVNERYAMLIDKKFTRSLTKAEQRELAALEKLLDEMEKPFYESIIKRLIVERDNLLKV